MPRRTLPIYRFRLAILGATALASTAALAACGSGAEPAASQSQAFAWLQPSQPPPAWHAKRLPDGAAQLAYPARWHLIRTDSGTVSAAFRGGTKEILGYLNATPRQGTETLANWSNFRIDHNSDEGDEADGDPNVKLVASGTGLEFRDGRGSCVIDDYTSSMGLRYREIACIVDGTNATTVVVGAAPVAQWSRQAPAIERAISSFVT